MILETFDTDYHSCMLCGMLIFMAVLCSCLSYSFMSQLDTCKRKGGCKNNTQIFCNSVTFSPESLVFHFSL